MMLVSEYSLSSSEESTSLEDGNIHQAEGFLEHSHTHNSETDSSFSIRGGNKTASNSSYVPSANQPRRCLEAFEAGYKIGTSNAEAPGLKMPISGQDIEQLTNEGIDPVDSSYGVYTAKGRSRGWTIESSGNEKTAIYDLVLWKEPGVGISWEIHQLTPPWADLTVKTIINDNGLNESSGADVFEDCSLLSVIWPELDPKVQSRIQKLRDEKMRDALLGRQRVYLRRGGHPLPPNPNGQSLSTLKKSGSGKTGQTKYRAYLRVHHDKLRVSWNYDRNRYEYDLWEAAWNCKPLKPDHPSCKCDSGRNWNMMELTGMNESMIRASQTSHQSKAQDSACELTTWNTKFPLVDDQGFSFIVWRLFGGSKGNERIGFMKKREALNKEAKLTETERERLGRYEVHVGEKGYIYDLVTSEVII